jgi:DNA-binding MarR family transcriptional regulator
MATPRTPSQPARDALSRLFELTVVMTEAMERDLAERGLSRARATVVTYLHLHGAMRQRELAEALRVSPRNVTGLLDGLQATGFVTRSTHPTDRRATLVTLTDFGTTVAKAMQTDERHFARYLFADLSDREVAAFRDTLDHLVARLHAPGFARLRRSALKRWPAR